MRRLRGPQQDRNVVEDEERRHVDDRSGNGAQGPAGGRRPGAGHAASAAPARQPSRDPRAAGHILLERLHELVDSGDYDVVVLDTPPARNALDFLDAPERMTRFVEGRGLRLLLGPRGGAGRAVLGTLLAGWAMLSALIAPLQAQEVYSTPTLEGPRATAASAYVVSRMSAGFAGAILVAHHGKVVLRGGYGMANRERGIPWSTSIVAPLGSVTKVFTAAAVVDLWDRKLLAPSDKLGKFFPRFTTASTADLTVQQLLTHTSGLDTFSGDDFEKIGLSEFLTRTLGGTPKSAPGTMRTSNIGFSLLAAINIETNGIWVLPLLANGLPDLGCYERQP